jgi:hypothetical protein
LVKLRKNTTTGEDPKKQSWRVSVKKFISNFDGCLAEIEHGRTILLLVHGKAQGKLVPIVDRRLAGVADTYGARDE